MRIFHGTTMAVATVLLAAASDAQTTYKVMPSPTPAGNHVTMTGTAANTSAKITVASTTTNATFTLVPANPARGAYTIFDLPRTVPEGTYRVSAYDGSKKLLGTSTLSVKGIAIEGDWYKLKTTADGDALSADGRLIFFPKTTPVAANAKIPELVVPVKGLESYVQRKVCKVGIPALPQEGTSGYWAPHPFGQPSWVWVIYPSKYPQYLAPGPYPTAPPPAPSKSTTCVPEADTRLEPLAR